MSLLRHLRRVSEVIGDYADVSQIKALPVFQGGIIHLDAPEWFFVINLVQTVQVFGLVSILQSYGDFVAVYLETGCFLGGELVVVVGNIDSVANLRTGAVKEADGEGTLALCRGTFEASASLMTICSLFHGRGRKTFLHSACGACLTTVQK